MYVYMFRDGYRQQRRLEALGIGTRVVTTRFAW